MIYARHLSTHASDLAYRKRAARQRRAPSFKLCSTRRGFLSGPDPVHRNITRSSTDVYASCRAFLPRKGSEQGGAHAAASALTVASAARATGLNLSRRAALLSCSSTQLTWPALGFPFPAQRPCAGPRGVGPTAARVPARFAGHPTLLGKDSGESQTGCQTGKPRQTHFTISKLHAHVFSWQLSHGSATSRLCGHVTVLQRCLASIPQRYGCIIRVLCQGTFGTDTCLHKLSWQWHWYTFHQGATLTKRKPC